MFKISTEASATRRWFVSSVFAAVVLFPGAPVVLPEVATTVLPAEPVAWAAPPPVAGDPGAQLNQARDYMERQRIAQQMEEDQERHKVKVETEMQKPEQDADQITFTLNRVDTDPSEILTEAEIKSITDPYVGKTASLKDLYDMTAAVNKLYEEKGYAICRAYLPPQRIHEGVVQIKFLEGKTGNVTINGLRFTRKGYVANRIKLEPGKVANTDSLNERLQRFNATNDVQLRILVHAGEKPGTTDYEIAAFEPKNNHQISLYMDNNGYDNSGRFRGGVFYAMRSVTGQRDALRMNYLRSRGTNIFGANYSLPVNNMGTVLDFDYGTNTTKIVKGTMESLGVKGHAYAAGITLRHPLRVDEKRRDEIGIQFLHQNSQTDIGTKSNNYTKWVDDTRNTFIPYISFTHYGKSSVLYHKHSLAFTNFNNLYDTADNYAAYRLDAVYQKRLKGGQMLLGRLNAQIASESKNMSSSDFFYIGGANSVRGYEESFLAGSQGFNASLTWQTPLGKKQIWNAFTFVDYGMVFGDEKTVVDQTLVSTGLGVTANYKNFYSNLTLGIPLKRDFMNGKVDRARIHFNCSLTF